MSVKSAQRQETLNRQLLKALGDTDDKRAIALVNAGADPNTPSEPRPAPTLWQWMTSPFHRTAHPDKITPTAFMLSCGEAWNYGEYYSWAGWESPQLIRTILHRSADIKVTLDDCQSPLDCAIGANHLETARILLENGADVNAQSRDGWTPLIIACRCTSPEAVQLLLDHRVKVNTPSMGGWTALHWAVMSSTSPEDRVTKEIIPQLLVHGADPNTTNVLGVTVLQTAQKNSRRDLVNLLRQSGAKK